MIQYYCIHHKPAIDRKTYIKTNIQLDPIVWVEEYHPLSNFINKHKKIYSEHSANKLFLNDAELSCYYKHNLAINMIYYSQEYGFVFEDDIEKPEFNLNTTLITFTDLMKNNDVDILFIGSYGDYDLYANEPTILCNELTKSRCAHAYLLHSRVAEKIKNYIADIRAPFDWQLNYAIQYFKLKSCWAYPHIYQRTEKNKIGSLLR